MDTPFYLLDRMKIDRMEITRRWMNNHLNFFFFFFFAKMIEEKIKIKHAKTRII